MNGELRPIAQPAPIRNLRITFWGVQGSCPIFPSPYGVHEYARRIALHTIESLLDDASKRGRAGIISPRDLLGGAITAESIEAYQRKLGLPDLPMYGGETTCIQVETSEGNIILLDAGSGIRRCSLDIVSRWATRADRTLHLFGSHEHLDHRSGLTFSRFCYVEPNPFTINVYGSNQFLGALDQHYGLFSHDITDVTYVDDPVDYTTMPATFNGIELRSGDDTSPPPHRNPHWQVRDLESPIRIGSTTIRAFPVYHVIPCCLAYRIEHNGKVFVFCTDHELRHGSDAEDPRQRRSQAAEDRLMAMSQDADLAYFDGQYYLEEYLGRKGIGSHPPIARVDWGHSCVEDVVARARRCNIKRTLVGHHDPERSWTERVEMDMQLAELSRDKAQKVQLANSDLVIDL